MTLNFDRVGRYLCKVVGGKYDGKVVSVATEDSDEINKSFTQITIDGKSLTLTRNAPSYM